VFSQGLGRVLVGVFLGCRGLTVILLRCEVFWFRILGVVGYG
jgi:hypothetical protein